MLKRITKTLLIGIIAVSLPGTAALQAQGVVFVKNNALGILQPNPIHPLHITANSGGPLEVATFENTGGAFFILRDFSIPNSYSIATLGGLLLLDNQQSAPIEFVMDGAGNVTITGALAQSSSRGAKHEIVPVGDREILGKVLEMPLASWTYNADQPGVRHLGPMAEDFYAAFGLGSDDRHMAASDSAGVALAAIKGLHEVVQEKDQTIEELRQRIEALEALTTQLLEPAR